MALQDFLKQPFFINKNPITSAKSFFDNFLRPKEVPKHQVMKGNKFFVDNKDKKFEVLKPEYKLAQKIGAHESSQIWENGGWRKTPPTLHEKYKMIHNNGALGYYGVERPTLDTYEDEIFGKNIATEEFLNSPNMQDKFVMELIKRRIEQGLSEEEIIRSWNRGITKKENWKTPEADKYYQSVINGQSKTQ